MQSFVRRCQRRRDAESRMKGPGVVPALFSLSGGMGKITEAARRYLAALLTLVTGIALSAGLFVYVRDDVQRDAQLRFERQAADAKHIIERRFQSYVGVTYGLKALFAASDSVSRGEFHRFVESLNLKENYPGFVQLNYARHISGGERARLEQEVRADRGIDPRGYPAFSIRPPGERPV